MAEERQITSQEIDVVRWLLANAAFKDVSGYTADSLEGISVVAGCQCGCASIDFVTHDSPEEPDARHATAILAEAFAIWPDGARAGVMLWGLNGRLLGIELYELDPVSDRFPTIESLRKWEDYFADQPRRL